METKSKTCYQLWGNDNFSNEEYLCGVYTHYSSAWRSKKRHEKKYSNPKYEDEVLGDKYWIVKTTLVAFFEFSAHTFTPSPNSFKYLYLSQGVLSREYKTKKHLHHLQVLFVARWGIISQQLAIKFEGRYNLL